jgi:hypothetical protein
MLEHLYCLFSSNVSLNFVWFLFQKFVKTLFFSLPSLPCVLRGPTANVRWCPLNPVARLFAALPPCSLPHTRPSAAQLLARRPQPVTGGPRPFISLLASKPSRTRVRFRRPCHAASPPRPRTPIRVPAPPPPNACGSHDPKPLIPRSCALPSWNRNAAAVFNPPRRRLSAVEEYVRSFARTRGSRWCSVFVSPTSTSPSCHRRSFTVTAVLHLEPHAVCFVGELSLIP